MKTLDMYTKVTKMKKLFRHFEKIPIPLPFPATATGLTMGVLTLLVMVNWGKNIPFPAYAALPLLVAGAISYYEPEEINIFQMALAYARRWVRPKRRIINRSVARIGTRKEYREMTYIREWREQK